MRSATSTRGHLDAASDRTTSYESACAAVGWMCSVVQQADAPGGLGITAVSGGVR